MDEVVEALGKYQGLVPLVYDIETMSLDEARSEDMQYAVYLKREADKVIAELEESHKKEVGQFLIEIAELKQKLEDEREFGLNRAKNADYEIGKLNEKIIVLKKSYKKLVKKFVHEISVAESYRSLIYKEDALKYQEKGNSEMYEDLSKKSDNAYRHANRWREIFRKMSQEAK